MVNQELDPDLSNTGVNPLTPMELRWIYTGTAPLCFPEAPRFQSCTTATLCRTEASLTGRPQLQLPHSPLQTSLIPRSPLSSSANREVWITRGWYLRVLLPPPMAGKHSHLHHPGGRGLQITLVMGLAPELGLQGSHQVSWGNPRILSGGVGHGPSRALSTEGPEASGKDTQRFHLGCEALGVSVHSRTAASSPVLCLQSAPPRAPTHHFNVTPGLAASFCAGFSSSLSGATGEQVKQSRALVCVTETGIFVLASRSPQDISQDLPPPLALLGACFIRIRIPSPLPGTSTTISLACSPIVDFPGRRSYRWVGERVYCITALQLHPTLLPQGHRRPPTSISSMARDLPPCSASWCPAAGP